MTLVEQENENKKSLPILDDCLTWQAKRPTIAWNQRKIAFVGQISKAINWYSIR